METVTISLETYKNMQKQIDLLKEEVKQKTIIKTVEVFDKERMFSQAIVAVMTLGLLALMIFGLHP